MRRFIHQKYRKRGLPAGALVRIQDEELPPGVPLITVFDFQEAGVDQNVLREIDEIIPYTKSHQPTWIDISGTHPISTIKRLGEILGLHALTLEDILNTDQRPKTEEFDDVVYTILKRPSFKPDQRKISLEQVSVILMANVVISIHDQAPTPAAPILARMVQERDRIKRLGSDYLAYVVIDSVVDEYFYVLETIEDQIQDVERALTDTPETEVLQEIHQLKGETILLRKAVWPMREVVAGLSETESPLFDEHIKVYLTDLHDNILQIIELTDVYRDMLRGSLDLYLSMMSHKMNQIMKTLTMIASIFIPLTLITGIYGMNFTSMPELHWVWGYPLTLVIMVGVAAGMLAWFKKRKWI